MLVEREFQVHLKSRYPAQTTLYDLSNPPRMLRLVFSAGNGRDSSVNVVIRGSTYTLAHTYPTRLY
jgi:hypothetical protein